VELIGIAIASARDPDATVHWAEISRSRARARTMAAAIVVRHGGISRRHVGSAV